jgi:fatty acid desaturase
MGKGANKSAAEEQQEVLIDGRLYDVSNFKHPGGSVIKFLTSGGDATEAFLEFHNRSKKAHLVLKGLTSRPAPPEVMKTRGFNGKEALTRDYLAFRKQLEKEGMFEPSPSHILYRVIELVVIHALGVMLFFQPNYGLKALGIMVLGIGSGRCGWLMHEGGHYSMTGNITTDRFLQIIIFGIGCGMSGAWWRIQHNKHHATPQKLKHDVDLDTLPLVAFNARIAEKAKNPLLKFWLKYQALYFTPLSCLFVALGWQYYLHPRHIVRTKRVTTEGASIFVRHIMFFGMLCQSLTWPQSIGVFLLYNMVASSYIFSQFAVSHSHLPVSEPDEYLHWVEYAAVHTTNVLPGPLNFVSWFMSYLNFQIEHHLFPGMPQFRHSSISPRVKELFKKHGLHYDERGWGECMKATWLNLHQVGRSVDAKKKN